MKNDKKIIMLIIILILLVVIFAMKWAISHIEKQNPTEQKIKEYGYETMPVYQDEEDEYVPEKTIKYTQMTLLRDLKGELPTSTVIKIVRSVFVEEIPDVIEDVEGYTEEKLKTYYEKNEYDIREDLYIDTEESFINMVKKFSELTSNLERDFATCDFTNEDGLGLVFGYENGEKIECRITGENANLIRFEF